MITAAIVALSLQGSAAPAAMQSSLQSVDANEAVNLFKQICFDPFPDPAKFDAVVAASAFGLVKAPETPSEAMQPGDAWYSAKARVTYVNADWLPRNFGTPQCSVTVNVGGNPTNADIVNILINELKLPNAKSSGNAANTLNQWDLPGIGADKWRLFARTQAGLPGGFEAQFSLLNLRGKKK